MPDSIDDLLNQDHIKADIDEFAEVVSTRFDSLDSVVILWGIDEEIHHRAYGSLREVVGLLEQAKYIMLRENTGGTNEPV